MPPSVRMTRLGVQLAVLLKRQALIKRREKERISSRCGHRVRERHVVSVKLAPAPGAGFRACRIGKPTLCAARLH